eukprot:320868-Rhodomonas_salina.1
MSDDWSLLVHTEWKVSVRPIKTNSRNGDIEEKGLQVFPIDYNVGIVSFNVTPGISYGVEISAPDDKWEYWVYDVNDADKLVEGSSVYVRMGTDHDVVHVKKVDSAKSRVAMLIKPGFGSELFCIHLNCRWL